jgi:hypothetical protein
MALPTPPKHSTVRIVAMPAEARVLQALLRTDFRAFLQKVFTALNPAQNYVGDWYLEAIAWQLERVRRGENRRLIINMPPRSLKSITASVAFPAFVLGHEPSRRMICVSYSGDLAKKHSNDFRAVLESPWYRSVFPNARIGQGKNSETEIVENIPWMSRLTPAEWKVILKKASVPGRSVIGHRFWL